MSVALDKSERSTDSDVHEEERAAGDHISIQSTRKWQITRLTERGPRESVGGSGDT